MSLTNTPCGFAENKLKIINNQPIDGIKKKFGVCVKQITLEHRNNTIKFIEWIHLLKILGADKIYIYNRYVHPETFKAMRYFEDQGILDVTSYLEHSHVPFHLAKDPTRTVEILSITDCFYRIRNLYEYIIVIDPDKVPVPLDNETTWHDFVNKFIVGKERRDYYSFHSLTYPDLGRNFNDKFPSYHYMLQHIDVKTFNLIDD